jgi:hypothetical protein
MLLFVTIAAVGFAWLGFKVRQAIKRQQAIEAILSLDGDVTFDYQIPGGNYDPNATPPGPLWLKALLGEYYFTNVKVVHWRGPRVTDDVLVYLQQFPKLEHLELSRSNITDDGLANLRSLANLQVLELEHASVTDAGLLHLQGLKKLSCLDLERTQVTDEGLKHIRSFPDLSELYLDDSHVTDSSLKEFQHSMPNVQLSKMRY